MTEGRAFGVPDGIEKRLEYWARQLSLDKRYPWVGMGLIDDLKCAAKMLGPNTGANHRAAETVEYDL